MEDKSLVFSGKLSPEELFSKMQKLEAKIMIGYARKFKGGRIFEISSEQVLLKGTEDLEHPMYTSGSFIRSEITIYIELIANKGYGVLVLYGKDKDYNYYSKVSDDVSYDDIYKVWKNKDILIQPILDEKLEYIGFLPINNSTKSKVIDEVKINCKPVNMWRIKGKI